MTPSSVDRAASLRIPERGRPPTGSAPPLSLVFLLLGFFAMLNALSVPDSGRTVGILNSLAAVFGPIEIEGAETALSSAIDGDVIARQADRLQDALRPLLPDAHFDPVAPGELARMTVRTDALFVGDSESPLPTSRAAVAAMAGVLLAPPPGLAFTLEILASGGSGGADLGARRAVRLARALVEAGVDATTLVAGIGDVDEGDVRTTVRWTGTAAAVVP